MRRRPQTRGGRIARHGFQMMWSGLLIVPVGIILAVVNAPQAVLIAVLVVLFAIAFAGLGVAMYGYSVLGKEMRGSSGDAGRGGTRQP